jgi:hypothetical protein
MARRVTINLEAADVFQIINALESRAQAYERTAVLMRGEDRAGHVNEDYAEMPSEDSLDQLFIPEECRDASEAEEIAKHFRDIIASLEKQIR